MTTKQAITKKWAGVPRNGDQARKALRKRKCPVCNSVLLQPIIRQPLNLWMAHCNSCGSETTMAALINRKAWRTLSNWFNRGMA